MNKLLFKRKCLQILCFADRVHTKDGGGLPVELSAVWVLAFVCRLNWGLYLSYRSSSVKILCL